LGRLVRPSQPAGEDRVARSTELVRGTLDLMVLKTLELGPRHGLSVAERIRQISSGTFEVSPGSLFPSLHRLEQDGLVRGEWTVSAEGRRVKAYTLTPAGRRRLETEKREWARAAAAVNQVLAS
jgi:transcriptional regulator